MAPTCFVSPAFRDISQFDLMYETRVTAAIVSGLVSVPAYDENIRVYTIDVPYKAANFGLVTKFATPGSVYYAVTSPPASVTTTVGSILGTGSWSAWLPLSLQPLLNTFVVVSSRDGNFTVTVSRDTQDVHSIALQLWTTAGAGPTAATLTPAYAAGNELFDYTLSVPYLIASVSLTLAFYNPSTLVSLSMNTTSVTVPASGVSTPLISLGVGANLLSFLSARDGLYTVVITRAPGDVRAMQVEAYPAGSVLLTQTLMPSSTPPFESAVFFSYSLALRGSTQASPFAPPSWSAAR